MTDERFDLAHMASGPAFSRRAALRGGLAVAGGLGAAAILGCGGDDDDDEPGGGGASTGGGGGGSGASGGGEGLSDLARQENAWAEEEGAPFEYHFAEPPGEPKTGGTLILTNSFPAGGPYDPTKSQSGTTILPVVMATNRLVGIKTGPEMSKYRTDLVPELADSWETSPDGLTYTFHLHPGIKWHNLPPMDGRPFVAGDLVKTYQRYADSVSRTYIQDVESFTAPDDETLVVKMKTRNPDILVALATHFLSIFPVELADQGNIAKQIVGTGPMVFDREDAASQYFTANPDYWRGRAYLDGIEIRHITNAETRTAAFRAGQVHSGPSVVSRTQDADLLLSSNPDTRIYTSPVLVTASVQALNLTNPKFMDDRVRRALSLAVDRPTYIQLAYGGGAGDVPSQAWTYVFDERPTAEEMGKWWHLDIDESKAQLDAAGASNLEFSILIPNNIPTANAETLVGMYKQAGINAQLQVIDYNEYLAQYTQKQYAESVITNVIGIYPAANFFYNQQVHSQSPQQYWNMNDPQIDAWADEQKAELDPDARRDILRKMWDQIMDKAYRIDLPQAYQYQVWKPSVRYARFTGPMFVPIDTVSWIGELPSKTWLDE